MSTVLLRARKAFADLTAEQGLADLPLRVTTRALSTEEAIGKPQYDDLPILRGKEVMIQAEFEDARGHAFTDEPAPWSGTLRDVLDLPLDRNRERALTAAAMNAVLRHLGRVDRTVHCRDEDIARCGREMAAELHREFGDIPVGVAGYQPGLVAALAERFGPDRVSVTDLAEENIGRHVHGIEVWSGEERTQELVELSHLVLATGTTAANGTLDGLLDLARRSRVPLIIYGVTGAAICHLCNLRRVCFRAA